MGLLEMALMAPSFDRLRQRYVERLDSVAPSLHDLKRSLEEGDVEAKRIQELKECAHRLSGSGGTFGFHHLSAAAFAAEDAARRVLIGSPDRDMLRLALISLTAAIEDAKQSPLGRAKKSGLWGANVSFLWPSRRKFKGRIVIVEDDPDIADLLYAELTRRGFKVEMARDGIAAIASIWNNPPHLTIVDRDLPLMAAESLVMELKQYEETRNIPLVVLSSLPSSSVHNAPATVYHRKPFDTEELMAICLEMAHSSAG